MQCVSGKNCWCYNLKHWLRVLGKGLMAQSSHEEKHTWTPHHCNLQFIWVPRCAWYAVREKWLYCFTQCNALWTWNNLKWIILWCSLGETSFLTIHYSILQYVLGNNNWKKIVWPDKSVLFFAEMIRLTLIPYIKSFCSLRNTLCNILKFGQSKSGPERLLTNGKTVPFFRFIKDGWSHGFLL